MIFTLLTAILAFAALAVAGTALSNSEDAQDQAGAGAGTVVTLTEFKIDPAMVEVAAGGSLSVKNAGTVVHNLAIEGTDLKTADIAPGASETLDISSLKAGDYTIICAVPGHKGAGMEAMLMVGGGGSGSSGAGSDTETAAQNNAADAVMKKPTAAFVAQLTDGPNTKGVGAQLLAPTVQADGTKQFDLTAKITDWEVEPGKTVKAWTYNGTVPGPTIKVQSGDKVRIVLDNQLPQSTTIHFHGILVPNAMDGVPDVTQPPVRPGKKFTYEFVAQGPAVGMYHSHDYALTQVPDGLAGAFVVGDEPIPAGYGPVTQEVPMMLNDAGAIGFSLNGKSFPATAPVIARAGETVEVHYMNEGQQIHPMHLHGIRQLVIAKDGNAVPQPYLADTVDVAPGERYTVLIKPTAEQAGVWAWHCHILSHAELENGMMFGMVTAFIVQ